MRPFKSVFAKIIVEKKLYLCEVFLSLSISEPLKVEMRNSAYVT